ncbi:MAG: hypothetical protein IJK18_06755 [Clostridia bacterium]|nr:hypothetical protein [Clostridia bacterium]
MKRIIKITLFLIVFFINIAQFSMVYATPTKGGDIGGKSLNPTEWDPSKYRDESEEKQLNSRAKIITTTIRSGGIVVSVVSLIVIGIKEMTASVEEKSVIKQAMPGYILGAIMVFVMTTIPTLIYEWVKDI